MDSISLTLFMVILEISVCESLLLFHLIHIMSWLDYGVESKKIAYI